MVVPGNNRTHQMMIVDAQTGAQVPNGDAIVDTTGSSGSFAIGSFMYTYFTNTVSLSANGTYYVVSEEAINGDSWFTDTTTVATAAVATVTSSVNGDGVNPFRIHVNSPGHTYGPVDFLYG